MRVLVLSHLFPNPCEPTRGVFVAEQIRALMRLGVEAIAVSPTTWGPRFLEFNEAVRRRRGIPARSSVDGFEAEYPRVLSLGGHLFSISGLFYYLCCRSAVRRLVREHKIELIHAHTIVPDGFAAVLFGWEFHIPVVCTVHGSDVNVYPQRSWATLLVTKWAFRRLRNIIVVSGALKEKVEFLVGVRNIEVIQNGANPGVFKPVEKMVARKQLNLAADKRLILFVGNLVPIKGIEYLLEAVARLNRVDMALCLVGDGILKESLKSLATSLGILDHCTFAGRQPHDEIALWLSAADCLVLPSLSEGFPTILCEAMMCRTPIVATAVGGIPEVIRHRSTGLLTQPKDVAGLQQAIAEVLAAKVLFLEAMVTKAEKLARDFLTWDDNARKTMNVYRQAVLGGAEAGRKSQTPTCVS